MGLGPVLGQTLKGGVSVTERQRLCDECLNVLSNYVGNALQDSESFRAT